MLFNSIEFAVFLPIVFILYWFILSRNLKQQNILLIIASYIFYGWWDWRFLLLLIVLSLANYFVGIEIENNQENSKGKKWFIFGLVINLIVLGLFKYFNFFIESFIDLISLIGYDLPRSTTKIILPVGISFYTFLSLSYIIDIQRKTLKANKNVAEVLLSLSFFPIILAGPIQRPASLLPQIGKKREFNYAQAVDGLKQLLWGLFTKVVIADNLAVFVDELFLNYSNYSGSTLFIAAIFYTIQIYADFSGYSDMAIGIAKLFGFSLMRNFAFPYFSRNIMEFWKRWHISLVSWFRDYVFLPFSFAVSWRLKGEKVLFIRNELFIYSLASGVVWFLTGLWHGANYTFIIWGIIHGLFLVLYKWQTRPRKRLLKKFKISNKNTVLVVIESLLTLFIVIMAWIFFRASSIEQAVGIFSEIFSSSLFLAPIKFPKYLLILLLGFIVIEWIGRSNNYAIEKMPFSRHRIVRWSFYYIILAVMFVYSGEGQPFIYFQF